MKNLLIGIFAHPDDEAFGPAAWLHGQAEAGTDIHLILVTDGESGINDGYDDLGAVRLQEWLESGRRIGAASNHALHYPDGGLCNALYLEITDKIIRHITEIVASYDEMVELHFMTYEERGITGHLDHIAVSFMTTYIYKKIEQNPIAGSQLGILRYFCMSKDMIDCCNCDWIYMPAGRTADEIDETVSYASKQDIKLHIMRAHVSQKRDMDAIIAQAANHAQNSPACTSDHFIHYK